jgi:hypothetical protein
MSEKDNTTTSGHAANQTLPVVSLAKLTDALSKAQSKISAPKKDRDVDFTDKNGRRVKYSYADLASVIEAVKGPLSENGLAVVHQLGYQNPKQYGLTTTLLHSSGESLTTWYPLPDPATKEIRAQEFGSALTYARRYSLSSLVGIASEEDDDGAAAAPTQPPPKQNSPPPATRPTPRDHVPGGANPPPLGDDLDRALANGDPFPDYENQTETVSLLDELIALAQQKNIPSEEMKSIIKKVAGRESKSVDLSQDELFAVIQYLNKFK